MYNRSNYIKLDMSAFDAACADYCYYVSEFKTFAKHYSEIRHTKEFWDNCIQIDADYWKKSAEADRAWDTLRLMCQLVGLDMVSVLRVFKAIRRNSQYQHGWEVEAHFNYDRMYEFEQKRPGSIESFCDLCRA